MMLSKDTDFNSQRDVPAPNATRIAGPRLSAVGIFAAVFGIISFHIAGWIIGALLGIIYVVAGAIASAHYPLDLHDAVVLEDSRAPETIHFTEAIAQELGIEPPPIYSIDIDRPQICVCAAGMGKRVRARIGVSKALLAQAENEQLHALLTVAMARIATGDASIGSISASLAGLPLQIAQAEWLNGRDDSPIRDPECGLSPFGKCLLVIFSPFARLMLTLGQTNLGTFRSDAAALKIGKGRVTAAQIDASLRWLLNSQTPIVRDPVSIYNPAESCLYLISPFEMDFLQKPPSSEVPLWKRSRFLVTSTMPNIETRIARIRALSEADEPTAPEVVFPVISDESV